MPEHTPTEEELDILYAGVVTAAAISLAAKATQTQLALDSYIQAQSGLTDAEIADAIFSGVNLTPRLELDAYSNQIGKTVKSGVNRSWGDGMTMRQSNATGETKFNWRISPGKNCPDCIDRSQWEPMTGADWASVGPPRSGVTLCQSHCNCILDSTTSGQVGTFSKAESFPGG